MAEGYVFEKANPKLKYIKLIGNKRDNKELMKKKRFNIYPYMKRQDDMENVLVEAKKTIKELDRRKANEEKN
jgi:hypothetical protein